MVKVLITFTSWRIQEKKYVDQLIAAYKTYQNFKCDIFMSANYEYPSEGITLVPYDKIGPCHSWGCHKLMSERYQDYDLVANTDGDVLLTEDNFACYVKHQSLSMELIPGLLVYEPFKDENYIISMPAHIPIADEYLEVGDEKYIVPAKKHSACFVADKERYKAYLESGHGVKIESTSGMNAQSMSRTNIYVCGKYKKVVPMTGIKDGSALALHLSGNHTDAMQRRCTTYITQEQLGQTP